jgi:hypothetical protein
MLRRILQSERDGANCNWMMMMMMFFTSGMRQFLGIAASNGPLVTQPMIIIDHLWRGRW